MARPRPEKKRQKAKPVQPPLPGMPPPEPPGTARVLPMQLQIGDRMTDSTGEWQVVGSRHRLVRIPSRPATWPASVLRRQQNGSAVSDAQGPLDHTR
jgi:hypothetical protein